jgi:hypothetical protein
MAFGHDTSAQNRQIEGLGFQNPENKWLIAKILKTHGLDLDCWRWTVKRESPARWPGLFV